MQRLIQKEKQVVQLQAELERYRSQTSSEDRDAVSLYLSPYFSVGRITLLKDERAKRDRDRTKWNALMEEIARFKIKASVRGLIATV